MTEFWFINSLVFICTSGVLFLRMNYLEKERRDTWRKLHKLIDYLRYLPGKADPTIVNDILDPEGKWRAG
jgi:hypothetical protein